jgi:hypothetical protein
MVSRAASMGPDAYKQLPSFMEFSKSLDPKAKPSLSEAQAAIKKAGSNKDAAAAIKQRYVSLGGDASDL